MTRSDIEALLKTPEGIAKLEAVIAGACGWKAPVTQFQDWINPGLSRYQKDRPRHLSGLSPGGAVREEEIDWALVGEMMMAIRRASDEVALYYSSANNKWWAHFGVLTGATKCPGHLHPAAALALVMADLGMLAQPPAKEPK